MSNDSAGVESSWLGRTHFSRCICYPLDSSAVSQLSFSLVDHIVDGSGPLEHRLERDGHITHHLPSFSFPKRLSAELNDDHRCTSTEFENLHDDTRARQSFRSISLPRRGSANDGENKLTSDSEDFEGAESSEKKYDWNSNVERGASWSEYFVTTGGESEVVETEEWMIDFSQLFLGHKFASGAFSRLYLGKYKESSVAVKILRPPDDDEEVAMRLERQFTCEVNVLSRVHHKNIVKFVGACRKPPVSCIVTEYLPLGSVKSYLIDQGNFSLPLALVTSMALDIAQGMEYLHAKGVIHRDLKSENLVLADDLCVKITDFGVACFESEISSLTHDVGTYRWMAPEMISGKGLSKKVDVYSFGIVLWELLTGQTPFQDLSPVQAAFAVVNKHARPSLPLHCPNVLAHLIHQCWSTDPDKRPNFSEIVESLDKMKQLSRLERNLSRWHSCHKHTNMFLRCFTACVSKEWS